VRNESILAVHRKRHLSLDERINRLAGRAISLSGEIYRSASPKYANSSDLLTGEGGRRFGGRWNPIGVATVYGSLTPETAMEETLAHSRYYSLPVHASMPRTFVAIAFSLAAVIDLTDGQLRQVLGVSEKRLLDCDWHAAEKTPITQEVGRAVYNAGHEAILVPSAADRTGRNLVILVNNLCGTSSLEVISPERLS